MRAVTTGRAGIIATLSAGLLVAACSATATDSLTSATTSTGEAAVATTTTVSSTVPPTVPPTTSTTTMVTTTTVADDLDGPVDAILVSLGDDRIAAFGGVACAEEVILLLLAIDRFETNIGHAAGGLADVEGSLGGPLEHWAWDGGDADPHPRPGSPCSSAGFESADEDDTSICTVERRTIETAVDTFRVMNPAADPPTEEQLVGSFLREPSERWDLDGWDVVPAPGSNCEPA